MCQLSTANSPSEVLSAGLERLQGERLPDNRANCCVGPVAGILALFDFDHFEPGVMQQATHLINGPAVSRGNRVVKRFCGFTLEKADEQAPLWRENSRELDENWR